ncbi:MAG: hypothetical protein ACRENU_05575 [Gemmatimonadaceae bacterium]
MTPRDVNPTRGFRAPDESFPNDWQVEETYWRSNWQSRPYTSADLGFEFYGPAYRYGYESARRNRSRRWEELEIELRGGWDRYEHRSRAPWENVKEAVRDAWNRVRGY